MKRVDYRMYRIYLSELSQLVAEKGYLNAQGKANRILSALVRETETTQDLDLLNNEFTDLFLQPWARAALLEIHSVCLRFLACNCVSMDRSRGDSAAKGQAATPQLSLQQLREYVKPLQHSGYLLGGLLTSLSQQLRARSDPGPAANALLHTSWALVRSDLFIATSRLLAAEESRGSDALLDPDALAAAVLPATRMCWVASAICSGPVLQAPQQDKNKQQQRQLPNGSNQPRRQQQKQQRARSGSNQQWGPEQQQQQQGRPGVQLACAVLHALESSCFLQQLCRSALLRPGATSMLPRGLCGSSLFEAYTAVDEIMGAAVRVRDGSGGSGAGAKAMVSGLAALTAPGVQVGLNHIGVVLSPPHWRSAVCYTCSVGRCRSVQVHRQKATVHAW